MYHQNYSGKWRIGRRVWFEFNVGAMSAQMNGRMVKDDGVITGTEKDNEGHKYAVNVGGRSETLVFEDEIKGYGPHPELRDPNWED